MREGNADVEFAIYFVFYDQEYRQRIKIISNQIKKVTKDG